MILHLFSGIRGWEALTDLDALGIDNDPDAVETSKLNRYLTKLGDVREWEFLPDILGLIASPPCTKFSLSGKGEGRSEVSMICDLVHQMVNDPDFSSTLDPELTLVLEPLRFIIAGNPEWIAMEQVPSVLPIWKAYEDVLRSRGYNTDSGLLRSEQFGLGTARERAFLIASRAKQVTLPRPTHSRFYNHRPEFLDPGLPRWKSMADILGWGMTHRPAPTITAGGTNTGGAEPFGNGSRQRMLKEYHEGRWVGNLEVRPTVRDLRLLQSIPDEFQFSGTKTSVVRQIGNAVPPVMGKAVLEAVR